MIQHLCSLQGSGSLQEGSRRANRAPRRPQDGPRTAQDGPKTAQDGPKTAQEGSKTAPRRLQGGPRGAQEASKTAPGRLQEPSWLPDLSREPPGSLPDPPGRPLEASGNDFHVEMLASNKDQKNHPGFNPGSFQVQFLINKSPRSY